MNKTRNLKTGFLIVAVFLIVTVFSACISQQSDNSGNEFKNGVVVSANPIASKVGVDVLKNGGNAIDAAVAVQFALAVVHPNAGNIGGGGFMVYRPAKGEVVSLDFREKAPAKAFKDMYLDDKGNPIVDKSLFGCLAVGVPGSVAGMVEAHEKYGKLPWKRLLEPAVTLAEQGFPVTKMQATELNEMKAQLIKQNPLGTALIKPSDWKEADLLIQPELAATLKLIQTKGRKGFYEGAVADSLVAQMKLGGGIINHQDLINYKAIWRKPITGKYRGYEIVTMPPPSSGGIALIQLLKSVEPYPLSKWGHNTDSTVQIMIEAERRVYADRAKHLGDPDFYPVPQKQLMDDTYIKQRMSTFRWNLAGTSAEIFAGNILPAEHEETTHFSIVDNQGNGVSITTTLNGLYGSAVVVKGAGFLLNNEMDDFSVKPGAPNLFGLVGGEANSIVANKRMLSSMTPTIISKNGKLFMVVGTPGGSTIITSVFQTILNVIDFKMSMQKAVAAKRFHHQWLPDETSLELGALSPATQNNLWYKGYKFVNRASIGRVDAILRTPKGTYQGGADHRGDDKAEGW